LTPQIGPSRFIEREPLLAARHHERAMGVGGRHLKAVSNLRGASVNQWGFFYMARDNNTAAS